MSLSVENRIRATLILAIATLTLAAWAITYYQVENMGMLMRLGVPMSLGMEGWADAASFSAFTGMWLVMMVAMMLPSTYPTLLLYRTVSRKRFPGQRGGTVLFASSYFFVWTATGILFFAAYVSIGFFRTRIPEADTTVLRAAGCGLILAGLYQWSTFKQACLRHCQDPLHFVMEHWRDGPGGAIRMGAAHGLYCFGCCWGLMTVLLVMGIMHLGWMAAIGAIILLEKIIPSGRWIPRAVGAMFIVAGVGAIISPDLLGQFSSHITIR